MTSQNGQTHFKNAVRFLKCVWPFWDVMGWTIFAAKITDVEFT